MEQSLQSLSMPIITAIVYWLIAVIKIAVDKEKFNRFIPLLACALGITCALVAFWGMPELLPTKNWVVALVIGGASGLSATGTNQIVKQLGKFNQSDKGNDSNSN